MATAKKTPGRESYEVYLEAAELGIQEQVGLLHRNLLRSDLPASFQYVPSWLTHPGRFMLDPRIDIHAGEQYPDPSTPGFGIFLDSAPDTGGAIEYAAL